MKLIHKITIIYLLISLIVFALGGVITFQVIKREVDLEQRIFLMEQLDYTLRMIETRNPDNAIVRDKLSIIPLGSEGVESDVIFSDTLVMHSTLQRVEPHAKLDVVKEVNGNFYKISLYDLIIEEDDIVEGVQESIIKMYLLLILLIGVLGSIASFWLLKPFNRTLELIKSFSLNNYGPTKFESAGTKEFNKLNRFLNEMTGKVRSDYDSLKEFTENAAHELLTPLSIINGKLELLLDSNNLTEEQTGLVISAKDSIQRLSKINKAMALLTKIENLEFENIETVNISTLLGKQIQDFSELINLKSIDLDYEIEEGVQIKMDSSLCTIMFINLLQNAIRHNFEKGKIRILLTRNHFLISNTGKVLNVKPESLFDRFKKDNQSTESIGLGLAIVKKICEHNDFVISYTNENEHHSVEIIFQ